MSVREKSAASDPARDSIAARLETLSTLTLVPNSGIQHLDLTLDPQTLQFVGRRFLEETVTLAGGETRVLHALELDDGVLYHPATRQPLPVDTATFLSGSLGIAPFVGCWMPLPYLRVLQGPDRTSGLDNGPSNWARAYVVPPAPGRPDAPLHIVLAFDTAIEMGANAGATVGPALAPVAEDVLERRRFALSDAAGDVAWLLGESWLDTWLERLFAAHLAKEPNAARPTPGLAYEHVARYLTFLRALRQGCALPVVQLADTVSAGTETVPVELVLDVGNARTSGVLVEAGEAVGHHMARARPVVLRDLSRPGLVHASPIESRLEFNRASYGDETLSRMSGRTNAFVWPSLVRIGPEAVRLASGPAASEGSTGLTAPKRYLGDTCLSDQLWRFSRSGTGLAFPMNPLVSGPMLSHLNEGGELLSAVAARTGTSQAPAIRPRFSRSALLGLFLVELILQAVASINAPATASSTPGDDAGREGSLRDGRPRRLRRIVVTAPFAGAEEDRAALLERVEGAVDLVWNTMGWADQRAGVPERPQVIIGFDEAMGAQLVFLYNEITQRLRTPISEYVELMGKTRPEHGARPALRVASLDVGGATTDLTIVTYGQRDGDGVAPSLSYSEKIAGGGDDILTSIVIEHIMPAMVAGLSAAGMADSAAFVDDALGVAASGDDPLDPFARRVHAQYALPLALVLLRDYERLKAAARDDVRWTTFGELARRASGINPAIAGEIETLAGQLGAHHVDVGKFRMRFHPAELSRTIRASLGPAVTGACRVVAAFDCDQVLLTGWSSRLRDVEDLVLEHLGDRADRIVCMSRYEVGAWYPFTRTGGRIGDPKSTAVVGALLASRASRPIDGVVLEIADLSEQARNSRLGAPQASPGSRAGTPSGGPGARGASRVSSRLEGRAPEPPETAVAGETAVTIDPVPESDQPGGLAARIAAAAAGSRRPEAPANIASLSIKRRDGS